MLSERAGNPLTIIGVVIACAAPAITLNVWPRIEAMLTGSITSNEVGIVLLVAASAMGMTSVPFAMQKSPNRTFWWTSLAFGIGLALLNYIMAVGAVGKLNDYATEKAAAIISKASNLKSQLEELRAARRELGAFKPTTEAQLQAADEAVRLAENAREQECGKVGDFCRARVAQLQTRLSERAEVAGALSLTRRASELDGRIHQISDSLGVIGPIPRYTNPQAERIKAVISFFWPAVATESVATGIIHFLAISAELFALGMPRIIVTALGKHEIPLPTAPLLPAGPTPLRIAKRARHQQNIAGPAPSPGSPPAIGATRAWKTAHLKSGTSKLVCWDVYQHYVRWCKDRAQAPASFTQFDFELCELGIRKAAEGRGSYYLEVKL